MLRSVAYNKGWTTENSGGMGIRNGIRERIHSCRVRGALRSVHVRSDDGFWSAQTAVLMPLIDIIRHKIAKENYGQLYARLRSEGKAVDPLDLQVGDLMSPALRRGFDRNVRDRVERLVRWRNTLAHFEAAASQCSAFARRSVGVVGG